ncbi:MAG TPA: UDP-N-acetylglucosamine 1-carboxyvinyltransferase, partial [Planctomycetaceae bacterium]|nr:UDP-N-acetylglucosamine 1-carboxyvinyltransferase [Planctomycetaceae bacterium]
ESLRVDHLSAVFDAVRRAGIELEIKSDSVRISGTHQIQPADIVALPYPGFPTDLQAQMTALMTVTPGISVVTDRVFPDRFMHAAELMRMGARLRRDGNSVIIDGVPSLSGAHVMASDLRASAALVIAALAAQGETIIRRIYHL